MMSVPEHNLLDLRDRLAHLAATAPPRLAALAAWLANQPQELAFHSVRSLAEVAGANPNTVVRLVQALGHGGYDEARQAVQRALRGGAPIYANRAEELAHQPPEELANSLHQAARDNVSALFSPGSLRQIAACVPDLLAARRVHCVGVRMSYALAHFLAYRGGVAHANIAPTPAQPGLILDAMTETGPDDIVIAISFAHYSAEVLRAAEAARARKARILAITDTHASPLAQGAWRVLCPPMRGPNLMYGLTGAFLMLEVMLEMMAAQDSGARDRVEQFENRLIEVGAYRQRTAQGAPQRAGAAVRPGPAG